LSSPQRATDRVFRTIAAEILSGELKAAAPLPTETELSDRFGVSRILVREALHRLKEYELVRVHQGNRTLVLDPDRAANVHLLGLETELMSSSSDWLAAFAERQIYSAAGLLALAERRIEPHQVQVLEEITERLTRAPVSDDAADWFEHTRSYWMTIAEWTKNRLYVRDTAWFFKVLESRPHLQAMCSWPVRCRAANHRRLNATLRARRGSAEAYLEMVRSRVALPARAEVIRTLRVQ